jgi:hypothetical protein
MPWIATEWLTVMCIAQVCTPGQEVQPDGEQVGLLSPTQNAIPLHVAVADLEGVENSPQATETPLQALVPALPVLPSPATELRIEIPTSSVEGPPSLGVSPASGSSQSNDENALPSPAPSPGTAKEGKSPPLKTSVLSPARVTPGRRGSNGLQTSFSSSFSSPTRSPLISLDNLRQLKADGGTPNDNSHSAKPIAAETAEESNAVRDTPSGSQSKNPMRITAENLAAPGEMLTRTPGSQESKDEPPHVQADVADPSSCAHQSAPTAASPAALKSSTLVLEEEHASSPEPLHAPGVHTTLPALVDVEPPLELPIAAQPPGRTSVSNTVGPNDGVQAATPPVGGSTSANGGPVTFTPSQQLMTGDTP